MEVYESVGKAGFVLCVVIHVASEHVPSRGVKDRDVFGEKFPIDEATST
jgi:hypothetical protein